MYILNDYKENYSFLYAASFISLILHFLSFTFFRQSLKMCKIEVSM
jgi:hypothetical protein